jgi:hypothetical protein
MDRIVGARGFPHDRDAIRVATKRRDVFVHPFQTGGEVMQRGILDRHLRVVEPTEYPQPIGDRYHYHALSRELLTVVVWLVTPAPRVSAAVDV